MEWVELVEPKTKQLIYTNLVTGECTWDPPHHGNFLPSTSTNWWELYDLNSGCFYYYNAESGKTTWQKPAASDKVLIVPLAKLQILKGIHGGSVKAEHNLDIFPPTSSSASSSILDLGLRTNRQENPTSLLVSNDLYGLRDAKMCIDSDESDIGAWSCEDENSSVSRSTDSSVTNHLSSSPPCLHFEKEGLRMTNPENLNSPTVPSVEKKRTSSKMAVQSLECATVSTTVGGHVPATHDTHPPILSFNSNFAESLQDHHRGEHMRQKQTSDLLGGSQMHECKLSTIGESQAMSTGTSEDSGVCIAPENGKPTSSGKTSQIEKPCSPLEPNNDKSSSMRRQRIFPRTNPSYVYPRSQSVRGEPPKFISPFSKESPVPVRPFSSNGGNTHLYHQANSSMPPSSLPMAATYGSLNFRGPVSLTNQPHLPRMSTLHQSFWLDKVTQPSPFSPGDELPGLFKTASPINSLPSLPNTVSVPIPHLPTAMLPKENDDIYDSPPPVNTTSRPLPLPPKLTPGPPDRSQKEAKVSPSTSATAAAMSPPIMTLGSTEGYESQSSQPLFILNASSSTENGMLNLIDSPATAATKVTSALVTPPVVPKRLSQNAAIIRETPAPVVKSPFTIPLSSLSSTPICYLPSPPPQQPAVVAYTSRSDSAPSPAICSSESEVTSQIGLFPTVQEDAYSLGFPEFPGWPEHLFRKCHSVGKATTWSKSLLPNPLLNSTEKGLKKQACETYKLIQKYMGNRKSRYSLPDLAMSIVQRALNHSGLRDEIYMQLCKQTCQNPSFIAFRDHLEAYLRHHVTHLDCSASTSSNSFFTNSNDGIMDDSSSSSSSLTRRLGALGCNTSGSCDNSTSSSLFGNIRAGVLASIGLQQISLQARVALRRLSRITNASSKSQKNTAITMQELENAKNSILNPTLFESSISEQMIMQKNAFPDLQVPWLFILLSRGLLRLNAPKMEGIFRVPADHYQVLRIRADIESVHKSLSSVTVAAAATPGSFRHSVKSYQPVTASPILLERSASTAASSKSSSVDTLVEQYAYVLQNEDVHTLAGLLKLWLREMAEPLIPDTIYANCLSACEDSKTACSLVNHSLVHPNRAVLLALVYFLQIFAQPANATISRMDAGNLAMVIAPNILRTPSNVDPCRLVDEARLQTLFLKTLIQNLPPPPGDAADVQSDSSSSYNGFIMYCGPPSLPREAC